MSSPLPQTHCSLLLRSPGSPLELISLPVPRAVQGSAVLRVLSAATLSYHREIHSGERDYPLPTPLVGGVSAIGRVVEAGPDATLVREGQLVFFDCTVRARDDPGAVFLLGVHTGLNEGAHKLSKQVWRNGAFAEYLLAPIENCVPLDEVRLCRGLGYEVQDLAYLGTMLVAYGGLRDIGLQAGDTVVVCPATGPFGGAGVLVAAAMGAKVVAMGRNGGELERVKAYMGRGLPWAKVEAVRITGDEAADAESLRAHGPIDAVLDLTPPAGAKSTHLRSAVAALRYEGRVSLMGNCEMSVAQWQVMGNNITLKGKLMYSREDVLQFVKILEKGMLPKGGDLVDTKTFRLEDWGEALDAAAEWTGLGKAVVFTP